MQRDIIFSILLFAYSFFLPLESLNRDYSSFGHTHCVQHLTSCQLQNLGISSDLAQFIPESSKQCVMDEYEGVECYCPNLSVYQGYVDFDLQKYCFNLKRHLEYCQENQKCNCYWPERSQQAAQISDLAYLLFRDLILSTSLLELLEDCDAQTEFGITESGFLNLHGLTISFIAHQLHFIDYYNVCRNIESYSIYKYEESEAAKIKDKLDDILEALYPKCLFLCNSCYKKHPSFNVNEEIRFMKLLVNDISGLEITEVSATSISWFPVPRSCDFSESVVNFPITSVEFKSGVAHEEKNKILGGYEFNALATIFYPGSDVLLEQGTVLNNLLLYQRAIQVLSQAIQLNPRNRDAYMERATAYFETNQFQLALRDYESAKKLLTVPPFIADGRYSSMAKTVYVPENKTEFSVGLVSGTLHGAQASAIEFVPSMFTCCRGILNGLWAFVCSPHEVSREMVNSAYAIGEFLSNHSSEECFQCIVPELKELAVSWKELNDHSKGLKIGYIIGKYGVDIFAVPMAFKSVSKIRALKRANTMCTLESCAISQANQAKILEESVRQASLREAIISEAKISGKILVRSSNTQSHIIQPKHAWDRIIKLTGNTEMDCRSVVILLEENNIFLEKYRKNTVVRPEFTRYDHQMEIGGFEVKAIFNKNPESGEIFLNDAWVVTK